MQPRKLRWKTRKDKGLLSRRRQLLKRRRPETMLREKRPDVKLSLRKLQLKLN